MEREGVVAVSPVNTEFQRTGKVHPDNRIVDYKGDVIATHSRDICKIRPCFIHEPSGHRMRDWPVLFRFDKMALVERLCEHGVGHPDPDSVHYFDVMYERTGLGRYAEMGVHGCDGCCFARP
jgi:hypothetical protein